MKTTALIVVTLFCFAVVLSVPAHAADGATVTKAQLATMVASLVGAEAPPESRDLPADEYYEVMANILATQGIGLFVGTDPDDPVTAAEAADVLYTLVGGDDATLDTNGRIAYLSTNGFAALQDPQDLLEIGQMQTIFNNPVLANAVAETYREPAGGAEAGERRMAGANLNAPAVVRESPASQV